jgi:hypothetical protein
MLATAAQVDVLQAELHELHDKLWEQPRSHEDVATALGKVNHEDRFDAWLETMPFPLASILWRYHTQIDPKERVDTLFHFFEAYAQFWATVLLSINLRDPREDGQMRVRAMLESQKQKLDVAGFGTWTTIVEFLAKEGRELRKKPNEAEGWKRRAALTSDRMTELLLNADVTRTLRNTGSLRNSWKGHGGIVSDDAAAEQVAAYPLYRMGGLEYRGGLFVATCERVVGTRTPFSVETIELVSPVEKGQLYMAGVGARDAMPLLPFVRLMASPKTANNACYFYNRKTKDGVRFVSYHFADDADVTGQFDDTAREIDLLTKGA